MTTVKEKPLRCDENLMDRQHLAVTISKGRAIALEMFLGGPSQTKDDAENLAAKEGHKIRAGIKRGRAIADEVFKALEF